MGEMQSEHTDILVLTHNRSVLSLWHITGIISVQDQTVVHCNAYSTGL